MTVAANGDLVVAGYFTEAGGIPAQGIARWNGTTWSALGSGIVGSAYALAALPNGDIVVGGELIEAGGAPVHGIARWNGSAWDDFGGGVTHPFSSSIVKAIQLLPNGEVIVGGYFELAGGVVTNGIARWNGTVWSPVGDPSGVGGTVNALARLANGDIVAGGNFGIIGGVPVAYLARWNGTTWSELGGGVDGGTPPFTFPEVKSLRTLSNGDLLVGGLFDTAGGVPAASIARWNGTAFTSCGSGMTLAGPPDPFYHANVAAVAVLPGDKVVAVGEFETAGGVPARGLAAWDGASWARFGSGTDDFVRTSIRLSNGDVVVGGGFRLIDGVAANSVARWNGSTWSSLGQGMDGPVFAVAQLPGGDILAGGHFLVAGGVPANKLARWNGVAWAEFGGGLPAPGDVYALSVMPNGDVLAGGSFYMGIGPQGCSVIRWNGSTWSPVGGGLLPAVYALQPMSNGDIIAGGNFNLWGGGPPSAIARFDGTAWSSLGSGISGGSFGGGLVLDLHVRANGDLIAVGDFAEAGGNPALSVASWNGTTWSTLGDGFEGPFPGFSRQVYAVDELPTGDLVAVGNFTHTGGNQVGSIARWNGTSWLPVGTGLHVSEDPLEYTNAFAVSVGPSGEIIAGGEFLYAGANVSPYVARWACPDSPCNPSPKWTGLPTGSGANGTVLSSVVFDDGSGSALYVGGSFSSIGGVVAHGLAKWNGASWTGVSVESGATVFALAVHDDGTGPALYVGGWFSSAGGVEAFNIARWNGTAWSAVGSGTNSVVRALTSFDSDGPGGKPARLVAGGAFTVAGGMAASHIAAWTGAGWVALGQGTDGQVLTLRSWTDGGGPALFVGGDFTNAGGAPANFIARWDGSWSTLQSGLGNFPTCMEVYNDGTGEALFVGGPFFSAGATPAQLIAKWSGASWSALAAEPNRAPQSLRVFDDGSGASLYAGGAFSDVGGVPISGAARWNGTSWSAVGTGIWRAGDLPQVPTLCVFDADAAGPAPARLCAGGIFDAAGSAAVQNIASWGASLVGPVIVQPPSSQSLYAGQSASLAVVATGNGTLTYQWRKNGTNLTDGGRISGANTSVLEITATVVADSGMYDVVVTDDCAPQISAAANLSVVCYANCDTSAIPPVLTANDFQCFLNSFAAGAVYANCDGSTIPPVLTANDFQCFLNTYAAGCP